MKKPLNISMINLEIEAKDKKALRIKARILQKTGGQEEAATLYDQIGDDTELTRDPRTLTDMAEAYFQSGKREKAVEKNWNLSSTFRADLLTWKTSITWRKLWIFMKKNGGIFS